MSKGIQSVKGMNDLLPEAAGVWHVVEDAVREVTQHYGYGEVRTPIPERTELFRRGIGEQTDIVEKEMFTWEDRGGESLTLRPENTAACVRAGIQHGLFHNQTQRLWYMGPMFRRERPQKGRYRQFHQFGIEAIGWPDPELDAEVILVAARLWKILGIGDVALEINTLGSDQSRAHYRDALVAYLSAHSEVLDEDSKRRLSGNPLRVLDSKNPAMQALISEAPSILDFLDDDARRHFDVVCGCLDDAGVVFRVSSRLVRGLDYYTSTVFEWTTDKLGAQSAVCGGGRYDGLIESLGGRATPATGFAIGLERLIELVRLAQPDLGGLAPDAFVIGLGERTTRPAFALAERLRDAGIRAVLGAGNASLKSQMKSADRAGARFAVILGENELSRDEVSVKPLTTGDPQTTVAASGLQEYLLEQLQ